MVSEASSGEDCFTSMLLHTQALIYKAKGDNVFTEEGIRELCWLHRRNTASTSSEHRNRFEQTSTPQWDRELSQLQEHGFTIFGYHAGMPLAAI